jgi:hypothetical protein
MNYASCKLERNDICGHLNDDVNPEEYYNKKYQCPLCSECQVSPIYDDVYNVYEYMKNVDSSTKKKKPADKDTDKDTDKDRDRDRDRDRDTDEDRDRDRDRGTDRDKGTDKRHGTKTSVSHKQGKKPADHGRYGRHPAGYYGSQAPSSYPPPVYVSPTNELGYEPGYGSYLSEMPMFRHMGGNMSHWTNSLPSIISCIICIILIAIIGAVFLKNQSQSSK